MDLFEHYNCLCEHSNRNPQLILWPGNMEQV